MDKIQFYTQRFGANMKAKHRGKGEYKITGVDWDQEIIELEDDNGRFWTNYKNVEIIKPQTNETTKKRH